MKILYTNKHKTPFLVDDEDYEEVRKHKWCVRQGYISRNVEGRTTHLHTFLLGKAPVGLIWDHENRDKLDNRRNNLRSVTPSVNTQNSGLRSTNTSGVRGVHNHLTERQDLWQARITVAGQRLNLGYFQTREEAVAARKKAEIDHGLQNRK